jgi:shikimate kinase
MHGVGRSSAALTVVNALPTGVGCAVGIARYATATVDLTRAEPESTDVLPPEADTPLVRASLRAALARFAGSRTFQVRVDLRSEVPMAKGLKSSSAVSTAVIGGVARALGATPSDLEVARLAAESGRAARISATGALDDGLAGLRAGFVLTDNRTDTWITTGTVERDWGAVVYVPTGRHPPSPALRARFEGEALEGGRAVAAARAGRFPEAMRLNSDLVERVMGYDYTGLRERLGAAGAIASGVSGLGPALAALVPFGRQADVLAALPSDTADRFAVRLTTEDAK